MKHGRHPSVAAWSMTCAALLAVLIAEIFAAAGFREDASKTAASTRMLEAKIAGYGPLAANRESLKRCEASFEDDCETGEFEKYAGDPLLSAKLQVEIFHALAESGMDEKTARERAGEISRSTALAALVEKLSSSKLFGIRRVEFRTKDDGAGDWMIAVSCDASALPKLLSTLDYPPPGLGLVGLRLAREKDGTIVVESRFEARKIGGGK